MPIVISRFRLSRAVSAQVEKAADSSGQSASVVCHDLLVEGLRSRSNRRLCRIGLERAKEHLERGDTVAAVAAVQAVLEVEL